MFKGKEKEWNYNQFGNINKRKARVIARIGGLQYALETHSTPNLRKLKSELKQEYVNILIQEDLLWKQRATCKWNLNEDRNTSFYHAYVKKNSKRKNITMLKLDSGDWCSDTRVLNEEAVKYFAKLYSVDNENIQQ